MSDKGPYHSYTRCLSGQSSPFHFSSLPACAKLVEDCFPGLFDRFSRPPDRVDRFPDHFDFLRDHFRLTGEVAAHGGVPQAD